MPTPGPWKYARAFANNAPDYFVVQPARGAWGKPAIAQCPNESNARLIAAAPDLLAALQLIERSDSFAGGSTLKEVQGIARAALAKVRA